jgi:hypothetical protein
MPRGAAAGERLQHGDVIDAGVEEDMLDAAGVHDLDQGPDITVLFHIGLSSSRIQDFTGPGTASP